jgi:hypothetical protein
MKLDFRNCKTPEDVKKVFEKNKPKIKRMRKIVAKLAQLGGKE